MLSKVKNSLRNVRDKLFGINYLMNRIDRGIARNLGIQEAKISADFAELNRRFGELEFSCMSSLRLLEADLRQTRMQVCELAKDGATANTQVDGQLRRVEYDLFRLSEQVLRLRKRLMPL